jgi:hypothetical protein
MACPGGAATDHEGVPLGMSKIRQNCFAPNPSVSSWADADILVREEPEEEEEEEDDDGKDDHDDEGDDEGYSE